MAITLIKKFAPAHQHLVEKDKATVTANRKYECNEKQIEYILSQLKSSHNRTSKTLRQQCKMFDQWLVELDKIKQSFEDK